MRLMAVAAVEAAGIGDPPRANHRRPTTMRLPILAIRAIASDPAPVTHRTPTWNGEGASQFRVAATLSTANWEAPTLTYDQVGSQCGSWQVTPWEGRMRRSIDGEHQGQADRTRRTATALR